MANYYEIYFDHKKQDGATRSMHMFNGPHESEFHPAMGKLKVRLDHLEESPGNPGGVRLSLTMTDEP